VIRQVARVEQERVAPVSVEPRPETAELDAPKDFSPDVSVHEEEEAEVDITTRSRQTADTRVIEGQGEVAHGDSRNSSSSSLFGSSSSSLEEEEKEEMDGQLDVEAQLDADLAAMETEEAEQVQVVVDDDVAEEQPDADDEMDEEDYVIPNPDLVNIPSSRPRVYMTRM
jgi:hypothetical protein